MTTTLFQQGVRFQDESVQITAASPTNRNVVVNGEMRIDQRNESQLTLNATVNSYNTVDRWMSVGNTAGVFSMQQTNNKESGFGSLGTYPPGLQSFIHIHKTSTSTVLGATHAYLFRQRIPYERTKKLKWGIADDSLTGNAGKGVTLSFWVKGVDYRQYGGSITNNFDGVNIPAKSFAFSFDILQPNSWERKKIYIPPPPLMTNQFIPDGWANSNVGMYLNFSLGVGTSLRCPVANKETWQSAEYYDVVDSSGYPPFAEYFDFFFIEFSGVQIEEGNWQDDPTIGNYEQLDMEAEFAECRRYYAKTVANTRSYAPVTNHVTTTVINYPPMRALPTATLIAGNRSNATVSVIVANNTTAAHRVAGALTSTSVAENDIVLLSAEI